MSLRLKKKSLFFLLLSLLLFGFFTFFGEKGLLHLFRLQRDLAKIKATNLKLAEENEKLREEIRRLQQEKRYLEEIARKELGLVREGELLYLFDLPDGKDD